MNLKLLFMCLFLAVLLIPAELKKQKKEKKHGHRYKHHHKKDKLAIQSERFLGIVVDHFFQILVHADNDDDDDDDKTNWLDEIQEPEGDCNPNPCQNNGVCEEKGKGKFECDCPKRFKGRRCEKAPKYCKRGRCSRGECVLTSTHPYFECKCKEPFQPPHCVTTALCEPNPCKNGGTCVKDGEDFDCECPVGYNGRFCHVGPDDCFMDDGESYRGNVSETDEGRTCLYWNSHFILDKGIDPFNELYEDADGLGPHNFCRNPDGDRSPWCFYRKGHELLWDYCDVTECPEATDIPTTPEIPDFTDVPTAAPDVADVPTAAPDVTDVPTTAPDVSHSPTAAPDVTHIPTAAPDVTHSPTAGPDFTNAPSVAPDVTDAPTAAPDVTDAPTAAPNDTETQPKQFSDCGKSHSKPLITRIYGGLKVPPGALPWQVSLQIRPKGSMAPYRHSCGGVLIESCWVLTAAHCLDPTKDMQVTVGSLSLNVEEPSEQTLPVVQAIRHANYSETSFSVSNDIALLKLGGNNGVCANESQFVNTACLPEAQLPDGTQCTISGWGATEESNHGSNNLLDAKVLLINQRKCEESTIYGKALDETMLCAGYLQGGVDSCQGDSGGPLTCTQNDTSVVYGLVSWGDKCAAQNKPGVYTRVTEFVDWIKSKMAAYS
ncbi:factor VII-activating protease-like [Genypterus blacodes]|uniref:factor VII-activating protease-like n=1 Tax=Genypterus blacodes TaxID=154954 RepID=UPI003F75AD25